MKSFFLALTLLLNLSSYARAASVAPDNPIIARGKGFEIPRSALDQVLATARAQHPEEQLPPDAEVHALIHLIEIQLVFTKATDEEKAEGKRIADERIASVTQTLGASEVERRLKLTHMTADDLRLMFAQEMTAQASLTRQLGIHVTDADVKKYFADHPGAFDKPAMAHVRELLLLTTSDFLRSGAPPLPPEVIQSKRKLAEELLKRARGGEDFATLAKQFNEDPISKEAGGELTFVKEQMEFGEVAFSMKPGQISDLLTNEDGFRIFQLLEILPAKKALLADAADQIKSGLIGEEKQRLAPAYIQRLKTDAAVEIVDPQLKASLAANEAEMAAVAKKEAEAQAAAATRANSAAQKEAEAKVFNSATTQPRP